MEIKPNSMLRRAALLRPPLPRVIQPGTRGGFGYNPQSPATADEFISTYTLEGTETQGGAIALFQKSISSALTDDDTTNITIATTAAVSAVHVNYSVVHSTAREVGQFDVVVDGAGAEIVNWQADNVGGSGRTVTGLAADQSGANLRINLTLPSRSAAGELRATATLIGAHS